MRGLHGLFRRAAAVGLLLAAAVVPAFVAAEPPSAPPAVAPPPASAPPRTGFDAATFKKPSEAALAKQLSRLQYDVTQHDATEPPFKNEYWDEHREGIYVDVVSGEVLFSSRDKFDSGTGWPSFTRPLDSGNVVTTTDWKLILPRTEVRSKHADSHLGHVFDDGPPPTGKRYCMNSAALRFIPASRLAEEGYTAYVPLFAKKGSGAGAQAAAAGSPAGGTAAPPPH